MLSIAKVIYYKTSEILIIKPKRNRFCYNIGRQHRRNGIFFQLNIADYHFSQKCYDVNCKGYQSEYFPLDAGLFFGPCKRKNYLCDDHKGSKKHKHK